MLVLDQPDLEQERHFRSLFDRNPDYSRLIENLRAFRAGLRRRGRSQAARTIKQLRREYDAVRVTDYFAGPAAERGRASAVRGRSGVGRAVVSRRTATAGGSYRASGYQGLSQSYLGHARAAGVDRLASAWLIKRFIDPQGAFSLAEEPQRLSTRRARFRLRWRDIHACRRA